MPIRDRKRVVVIGAGFAGLSAAHALSARGDVEVVVLEASETLGGLAQTEVVDGDVTEWGPEGVVATPSVLTLMQGLGVETHSPRPSPGGTLLSLGGRLRPLPLQLATGAVPSISDVAALVHNGVLPKRSLVRMAGEPLAALRSRAPGTLAETYGGLIGHRAMRRLIAPFAEGVLGSPAEVLADDVVPRPDTRSLALAAARQGLRRRRPPAPGGRGPGLLAAEGGMQRLVDALAASTEVRLGVPVTSVGVNSDGTFVVRSLGESFLADAVVVAVPAPVAGRILTEVSGSAATALGGIATSSSAVLHVDVVPEQQGRLSALGATGWLAAPEERAAVSAASFVGVKWPHLGCPGRVRAVVRRPDLLTAPDEQLLCVALDEIERVLGLHTERHQARLRRWSGALPVRAPGTAVRVAEARAHLPAGIELAGTAHAAVGVTAALASGQKAADRVVA